MATDAQIAAALRQNAAMIAAQAKYEQEKAKHQQMMIGLGPAGIRRYVEAITARDGQESSQARRAEIDAIAHGVTPSRCIHVDRQTGKRCILDDWHAQEEHEYNRRAF
jgi:hypothetical protein